MASAQDVPQDDDPFASCYTQLAAVTTCYGDEWSKLPACLECAFDKDEDTTLCAELDTMANTSYDQCVQDSKCDANCVLDELFLCKELIVPSPALSCLNFLCLCNLVFNTLLIRHINVE